MECWSHGVMERWNNSVPFTRVIARPRDRCRVSLARGHGATELRSADEVGLASFERGFAKFKR